jgi:threonine/homoserine/homoserine lactone efflux protein
VEDPVLLLRGLIIGFSIAAPVGPIGVLCIRRTLAEGFHIGLLAGLGAASADAIYGLIAAFGLTAISNLLLTNQTPLRLVGGAFLCYLGLRTFLAQPAALDSAKANSGALGAYASTFVLTMTNPMTIISFAAIFAGAGLAQESSTSYTAPMWMVAGVFLGSALWWLTLSTIASILRSTARPLLLWINRVSGVVIFVFGLLAIGSTFV